MVCLPVITGTTVMRQGRYIFIKHILSILIFKIDMVCPGMLTAFPIIVGKQEVAVLTGQIAQDLFVHDGDLALDRSLL